ncbi:MAG TPA: hypothetical protein VHZ54_13980 [Solirubrobacterales bacterium]|nr:hypothetical protein [Solirubrobacterales bacterium]
MPRPSWKLTVRNGAEVDRDEFDDLAAAVASMRERALAIRAEGPPKTAKIVRKFEPKAQVTARLEVSRGGLLRKQAAGIDVRGDGTFTPYRGGLRREELDPSGHDTPFDLVRETLEGADR